MREFPSAWRSTFQVRSHSSLLLRATENASKLGWRSMYHFLAFETARYGHGITVSPLASALWPVQLAKEKIYFFVEVLLLLWRTGKSRKIFHVFHLSRNTRVKELRNVYYLSYRYIMIRTFLKIYFLFRKLMERVVKSKIYKILWIFDTLNIEKL